MKETSNNIGRNKPCPCGSGKKYKRCCGKGAAPQLGTSLNVQALMQNEKLKESTGGFDPNNMDPALMMQFAQAMQSLPKKQLKKFRAIMNKTMQGQDVTAEAEALESSLPPALKNLLGSLQEQMPSGNEDVAPENSKEDKPAENKEAGGSFWDKFKKKKKD